VQLFYLIRAKYLMHAMSAPIATLTNQEFEA